MIIIITIIIIKIIIFNCCGLIQNVTVPPTDIMWSDACQIQILFSSISCITVCSLEFHLVLSAQGFLYPYRKAENEQFIAWMSEMTVMQWYNLQPILCSKKVFELPCHSTGTFLCFRWIYSFWPICILADQEYVNKLAQIWLQKKNLAEVLKNILFSLYLLIVPSRLSV